MLSSETYTYTQEHCSLSLLSSFPDKPLDPCKLVLGQPGQDLRGSQELAIPNGLPLAAWLLSGQDLRLLVTRLQGSGAKASGQYA